MTGSKTPQASLSEFRARAHQIGTTSYKYVAKRYKMLVRPACPDFRACQSLNANVAAEKVVHNPSVAVSFPTDNSKVSQLTRIEAAIVTLQNLNGSGVGCPAASTTFIAQRKVVQGSTDNNATTTPSSPLPPSPSSSGAIDPALVPDFGVHADINPTGTGDCDGIKNDSGRVIKIPCACPPDRDTFINVHQHNSRGDR